MHNTRYCCTSERGPIVNSADQNRPLILLTGGSGYVGGRLITLLERQPGKLRCLARSPEKMRSLVQPGTEVVQGDVLVPASLARALQGSTQPTTSFI